MRLLFSRAPPGHLTPERTAAARAALARYGDAEFQRRLRCTAGRRVLGNAQRAYGPYRRHGGHCAIACGGAASGRDGTILALADARRRLAAVVPGAGPTASPESIGADIRRMPPPGVAGRPDDSQGVQITQRKPLRWNSERWTRQGVS